MASFVFISDKNRERYLRIITPMGNLLAGMGVHPHALTVSGLILSLTAALLYSSGSFFWAAWVVALAGTCDTLDGQLARKTHKNSDFGAFFDSTMDRYSDMLLYVGLAYHFAGGQSLLFYSEKASNNGSSPWTVLFIMMAMVGSFMVSYTRARAEALGIKCNVGLMQRPERVILLIIGSLLGVIPTAGPVFLKIALFILALTSNITAIHRMIHVRNQIFKGSQSH